MIKVAMIYLRNFGKVRLKTKEAEDKVNRNRLEMSINAQFNLIELGNCLRMRSRVYSS